MEPQEPKPQEYPKRTKPLPPKLLGPPSHSRRVKNRRKR